MAGPTQTEAQAVPQEAVPQEAGRRLHPKTLVQRVAISLPGVLFILLPLLRSSRDGNAWFTLLFAAFYGLVALPLIFLQYNRFRYWITPKEIVIRSGVLNTQHRSIPIERIQNIETEQSLLPRLLGTAKVKIVTAGSAGAEGVLEYVSLKEAQSIRQTVRAYQRRQDLASEAASDPALDVRELDQAEEKQEPAVEALGSVAQEKETTLFAMSLQRALLSGAFRFSLLYIALIFSAFQYLDIDPEYAADWLMGGRLERVTTLIETSPWLVGIITVLTAASLSWITGILINVNKYYRFRLALQEDKLYKKSGLLTVSEGTIPLGKVQALILRTNPLMRYFGWYALELQTMGLNVEQRGYQVAAPFARLAEVLRVAQPIYPFALPDTFTPVSKLMIRRTSLRYAVSLGVAVASIGIGAGFFVDGWFWRPVLWGLAALPLLVALAYAQWRRHAYAFDGRLLFIRSGVVGQYLWVLPVEKFQVLYASQSIFQRRLGLKSLYIDTAGAGGLTYPEIMDVRADVADRVLETLHRYFQAFFDGSGTEERENGGKEEDGVAEGEDWRTSGHA
ncbi:MAG: PH domain-containing protein [Rhodothermales bacterium]